MSLADAGESHQPVLRLSEAGAQTVLEQFRGSPLINDGKVVIIALDAIAQRLGSRWAARSDLVHEHAQRVLRGQLGSQTLIQRISDTEYIVAQADVSAVEAQLRSINGLREILTHFLGSAPISELQVCQVTRITEEGVYGRQVNLEEVEVRKRSEAPPPSAPPPVSYDVWTPFATSTGARLEVSVSLEPVIALKTFGRIGYRIAARVQHQDDFRMLSRQELDRLSPADLARLDLGAIARGLDRLRSIGSDQKPATLILPVSFSTLRSRAGRAPLLTLLRQARAFVGIGLICEATRCEGAPPASLQEAVAAIRPLTLHTIVHLADIRRDDARHLIGVRFDGVASQCPGSEADAAFAGCVRAYAKVNAVVSRSLFLYQLPDVARARLAAELGVTHVTLSPQHAKPGLLRRENDDMPSPS